MDQLLIELTKQIPSAVAVIGTVFLFLKAAEKERAERIVNAMDKNNVQRLHDIAMENSRRGRELEINNLWATTVKNMMSNQESSDMRIVEAIKTMQIEITNQYKKMGITRELIDMAKNK